MERQAASIRSKNSTINSNSHNRQSPKAFYPHLIQHIRFKQIEAALKMTKYRLASSK